MKAKIWVLCFLLLTPSILQGVSFKEAYLFWAKEISTGLSEINEPIVFRANLTSNKEVANFLEQWRPNREFLFKTILKPLDIFIYGNEKAWKFDTRSFDRALFSSILNSRQPIFNIVGQSFPWKTRVPLFHLGYGRAFKYFSFSSSSGYLEYFQFLTLKLLYMSRDLRFADEARQLKAFLNSDWDELRSRSKSLYLCITSYCNIYFDRLMIDSYLKLCENNGVVRKEDSLVLMEHPSHYCEENLH